MAKKLAEAFVVVKIDNKLAAGLALVRRQINRTMVGLTKRMARMVGDVFSSVVTNIKRALLGVTALFGFIGVSSIKMAAQVQESENLFEVSMGAMAGAARQYSESMSKSLGLFAPDVRKTIGTFNVMLKSMGLSEQQAYAMATSLSQLEADLTSFFDLAPGESFLKLQSAISGEIEPLRRLGVNISEARVKAFAFANGIGRLTKEGVKLRGELTDQEKLIARYGLIIESTKDAHGDLERTQGSLSNSFRRLGSNIKALQVQLGNIFTKDVTKMLNDISKWVIANAPKIIEHVQKIRDSVAAWIKEQGGISGIWENIKIAVSKVVDVVRDDLIPVLKKTWDLLGGIEGTIDKIVGGIKFITTLAGIGGPFTGRGSIPAPEPRAVPIGGGRQSFGLSEQETKEQTDLLRRLVRNSERAASGY